ncbi:MAG: hypothetical protein AAFN93_02755 [Bacteroidota bacterium]
MPKDKSDALFQLIKSLKKSEKRYFKLFVSADADGNSKKYLLLFDLIDRQKTFDEEALLAKAPNLRPTQLSNLKAHLYKKILQSIRSYDQSNVIDIQIREMIDHTQILFNRSLYGQCAALLKKAKKLAQKIDNLELQLEILKWEKNLLTQTVGPDSQIRANKIIEDVQNTNRRINNVNNFTNLSVKLNSLYVKMGFIRSKADYNRVINIFNPDIIDVKQEELSPNEKLNLYPLLVGYYFFLQDFENGYLYSRKWVDLFDENKELQNSKMETYLNAINNLMIAEFKLYRYHNFVESSKRLRSLRRKPKAIMNENIQLKLIKYTYVHEFNRFFMLGDFDVGVSLINKLKPGLENFIFQLDNHSRLIMYYKLACLYFGSNDYNESIVWLNRILNYESVDIREDIHSFARILNLICHYELGNTDVIDYYIRSTYRFILKKDDMYLFQKYILRFLKLLGAEFTEERLIPEFKKLRAQLLPLQDNPYEKRAFIYFDIISWLESKIERRKVQDVIAEKAKLIIDEQRKVA